MFFFLLAQISSIILLNVKWPLPRTVVCVCVGGGGGGGAGEGRGGVKTL